MADIPEEHLTEELLDRLLASASIEQYLDEGLVSARTLTTICSTVWKPMT